MAFLLYVMLCVPTHAPDACDMLLLSVPPPKGWGENSKLTLRRGGGGSWAREFRGRLRTRARDTKNKQMFGITLWLYYVAFNFHTLSYCNQRGVSLFLSSSSFSCLGRATRIYPTDTAWHSASGNVSARTNPLPLVRMLSCVNSVWEFGRLQTSQNFSLSERAHQALSFLSACLSGGSFVREFSRCDPVGAFRGCVRPVTGLPLPLPRLMSTTV